MHSLLYFSVGPVAEFVEAARRTRDAHYASWLVGEMAREATRTICGMGAQPIIPATFKDQDPVSDRVLVLVPDEIKHTLPGLADEAQKAARAVWIEQAGRVLNDQTIIKLKLDEKIWTQQLEDPSLIEFFAVWTPLAKPEDADAYSQARKRVEALLDARENLMNFDPNTIDSGAGIDKSSLDGRRESVLERLDKKVDPKQEILANRQFKGIKGKEALDMLGLVKRLGRAEQDHFVSVSRLAADPWIRGCVNNKPRAEHVASIHQCCKKISSDHGELNWAMKEWVEENDSTSPWHNFVYNGQLLFKNRVDSMVKDYKNTKFEIAFNDLLEIHKRRKDGIGEPQPYLAVLCGDGDHMGRAVKNLSKEEHFKFSEGLSEFAREVKNKVRKYYGSTVYAGGDDVLAFLPLDMALPCANDLRTLFEETLKGHLPDSADPPTFSIGLVIGHMLTPMAGKLIHWAHEAEKNTKTQRNSLAVHFHPRSGPPIQLLWSWNDEPIDRFNKIQGWLDRDILPLRAAYHLRTLARQLGGVRPLQSKVQPNWATVDLPAPINKNLLQLEAERILQRKNIEEDAFKEIKREFSSWIGNYDTLMTLTNSIIVAQRILKAEREAKGE